MNQGLFDSWLLLQCRAIPGVRMAMARLKVLEPGQQALTAIVPPHALSANELDDMVQLAQRGGRTVVFRLTNNAGETDRGLRLAQPLTLSGETIGAIALELKRDDLEQKNQSRDCCSGGMPG